MPGAGAVRVRAGARLHAGFYHAGPGWGFQWGSAGFYAEEPAFEALVEEWPGGPEVEGARESLAAVEAALRALGRPPVRVRVVREQPRHAGLGSTTQAMLSVYCAASAVLGRPCEPASAAAALGRGRVSGVGVLAFKHGGFVADAGAPDPQGPRLLLRHPVPDGWVFVIAIPGLGRGPGEAEEERVLSRPWRAPPRASQLMAEGFLRLSAGVARGDLGEALEGLSLMQAGTGLYFSRLQGGVYRADLAGVVAEAEKEGLKLAQSSWGPTLYTIVEEREASWALGVLRGILRSRGVTGEVVASRPRNRGASLEPA